MGTQAAAAMHLVLSRPQAGTDRPYPCPVLTRHPRLGSSDRPTPTGAGNAQWLWTTQRVIPPPPPPALLYLVLARPPVGNNMVADLDDAAPSSWLDTPPLRRPGVVPFLWEEAPGKPKQVGVNNDGGGCDGAQPVPLKLPPRLQAAVTAELSLSCNPVLQGPCRCTGSKRTAMSLRSGGSTTSCRAMPSAIGGLFSWRKALAAPRRVGRQKGIGSHHHHHNAFSWSTATSSSALSASSSSLSCFCSDNGHGAQRRSGDGAKADSEDDQLGVKMPVRIIKLRTQEAQEPAHFPSMTMDTW